MSTERALATIERTNKVLEGLEDTAIAAINRGLAASFSNLERQLRLRYNAYTTDAMPNLLPMARAQLLLAELLPVYGLVSPADAAEATRRYAALIAEVNTAGAEVAVELMRLVGDEAVQATVGLPVEAIAAVASGAASRLQRHGATFRDRAQSLLIQSLTQNWGISRLATTLREQLGTTQTSAMAIARTESLIASNQSALATYRRAKVDHWQLVATSGDNRTCPWCVGRNMNVYRLGDVLPPPLHVQCRCFASPWRPSWQEAGLTDDSWAASYREQGERSLAAAGKKAATAPTPFERAAGIEQAPRPIWQPGS